MPLLAGPCGHVAGASPFLLDLQAPGPLISPVPKTANLHGHQLVQTFLLREQAQQKAEVTQNQWIQLSLFDLRQATR
jgi:hypothetical protein